MSANANYMIGMGILCVWFIFWSIFFWRVSKYSHELKRRANKLGGSDNLDARIELSDIEKKLSRGLGHRKIFVAASIAALLSAIGAVIIEILVYLNYM